MDETIEKVNKLNLTNIEIFTYHSYSNRNYNTCYNDYDMKNIIIQNIKCKICNNYDIIILDECQDMNIIYFEMVCKIYKDNNNINAKFCIFGDVNQAINQYIGSDERYIECSDKIFNLNKFKWINCNLSTSYRLSDENSAFINNCIFNEEKIKTIKSTGVKPKYIIYNAFNVKIIYDEIIDILKTYKPCDIFILGYSVKSDKSPIKKLENYLKYNKPEINIYAPSSEEEHIDKTILDDKLVFMSFHQSKGLERKVVFLLGFDKSYEKYYNRDVIESVNKCPNPFYVAITRPIDKLIIMHSSSFDYFDFIDKEKIKKYCDFVEVDMEILNNNILNNNIIKKNISVTNLIKKVNIESLYECFNKLNIQNIRKIQNKIHIVNKIKTLNTNHGYENVSDINGIAIIACFEYLKTKQSTIINYCSNMGNFTNEISKIAFQHKSKLDEIWNQQEFIDNIAYISSLYSSLKSKLLFKFLQLNNFDWITRDILKKCITRLNELNLTDNVKMEEYMYVTINNLDIIGCIDCIDGDNIYEFKCVDKLSIEHYLQLVVYMYINETIKRKNKHKINEFVYYINNNGLVKGLITEINTNGIKINNIYVHKNNIFYNKYYLYNVLTDELNQIICTYDVLEDIMKILLQVSPRISINTINFIDNMRVISNGYNI